MESDVDARVFLKSFDEGQITMRVGLLKNMAKVAAGLMRVN
jgi:hypothetical protein